MTNHTVANRIALKAFNHLRTLEGGAAGIMADDVEAYADEAFDRTEAKGGDRAACQASFDQVVREVTRLQRDEMTRA